METPESLAPDKARSVRPAGKVMASGFRDAKGVLLPVDNQQKGHVITGVYDANLLTQLREKVKKIQGGDLRYKSVSGEHVQQRNVDQSHWKTKIPEGCLATC